ncbi:hypothetical protein BHE90_000740 [Fusarium euwallaceae]|uniref:Uncharacterized protein n=1 Tax=Fusarium euwallaceae TaxID=1147111 RepID=A0A430M9G3_9HYPO|nr:hypothetical protein BHE90_000740 [Fusarium euwallaceae]
MAYQDSHLIPAMDPEAFAKGLFIITFQGRDPDFGTAVIACFVILLVATAVAELIISAGRNISFIVHVFVLSVAIAHIVLNELPVQETLIEQWLTSLRRHPNTAHFFA